MSEDFKIWWHREGSGMPPLKGEETCEHVERVSAIAWSNGAYKATEALKAENARLKTEVEHLMIFCNCTLIPSKELQAQVERLTKAGDAMAMTLQADYNGVPYEPFVVVNAIIYWRTAKEGKGQS
jgi:hypothetical protein